MPQEARPMLAVVDVFQLFRELPDGCQISCGNVLVDPEFAPPTETNVWPMDYMQNIFHSVYEWNVCPKCCVPISVTAAFASSYSRIYREHRSENYVWFGYCMIWLSYIIFWPIIIVIKVSCQKLCMIWLTKNFICYKFIF